MKKRKRKKRIKRRLLFIIILGILLVSFYNGGHKLETTHYDIENRKIPEEFDGFKIVQLSDLHGADFGDELYEKVRAEHPDIIALTGDFITTTDDIPVAEKVISQLATLTAVYYISGNHDYGSGDIEALTRMLDRHGVRFLKNEYEALDRNGAEIIVAGVEDPNSWADMVTPDEFAEEIACMYPDTYTVLLGHRNYWAEEYPALPVDLILCGHAHGGIVRLPGVGGIFSTDRSLFPDYDAGRFTCGQYDMIVSRGLGNSVAVPRLNNCPEIVSVTLHSK